MVRPILPRGGSRRWHFRFSRIEWFFGGLFRGAGSKRAVGAAGSSLAAGASAGADEQHYDHDPQYEGGMFGVHFSSPSD